MMNDKDLNLDLDIMLEQLGIHIVKAYRMCVRHDPLSDITFILNDAIDCLDSIGNITGGLYLAKAINTLNAYKEKENDKN